MTKEKKASDSSTLASITEERCSYKAMIEYVSIMKLKGSTSIKYAKVYFTFLESKAIAAL